MTNSVTVPNLDEIDQTMAEICQLSISESGSRRHLLLGEIWIFKRSGLSTTSKCIIVPNFVKKCQTATHIWLLLFFQDGGCRRVWFSTFQIFNSRNGRKGRTASSCPISSKSLEPRLRYHNFPIFPSCPQSAILDFSCVCRDHPRTAFGGIYDCAKFDWNLCSSFQKLIFPIDIGSRR